MDAALHSPTAQDSRLAILPGLTHHDIFMSPRPAETAIGFLDAPAN